MRKEVKHFGMSAKAILMVMVVFGTLFASCYTKDDIPVVQVPEEVPNKYIIEGTIVANTNGVLETLKGVTVTSDKNGVVSSGDANFIVTVGSPDTYTLSLSKTGYDPISYKVVVPSAGDKITGQLISVNVQLTMYRENTSNPGTGEVGVDGGNVVNGNGTLTIPAGALTANTTITMSVNDDVKQAVEVTGSQEAAAQFLLGEFGPGGTKFLAPVDWSVAYDALSDFYLANTQLQYRANNNAGDWTVMTDGIVYDNDNDKYNVSLTHFSQYRMVYLASGMTLDAVTETLPAIATILNTNPSPASITEIPYKKYEGAELTLGDGWNNITNASDQQQIEELVKNAVMTKVNVSEFKASIGEPVAANYVLRDPITLPYDYHLLSKGEQSMDYYVFTFKVYKKADNATVELKVNVKVAGKVSIFVEMDYCGAHHTHGSCGHVYHGGASGGMVIGD